MKNKQSYPKQFDRVLSLSENELIEVEYESQIAKRFNEIGFFKDEVETIKYWAELSKVELENKHSSSFHLDYFRALNIACITTYAKFFSTNRGFGFKPDAKKILNTEEYKLHNEVCELRNKSIAHIDSGRHFSSNCKLLLNIKYGIVKSVRPDYNFSIGYNEQKTDMLISIIDKVLISVNEEYNICAQKIFTEYQNKRQINPFHE